MIRLPPSSIGLSKSDIEGCLRRLDIKREYQISGWDESSDISLDFENLSENSDYAGLSKGSDGFFADSSLYDETASFNETASPVFSPSRIGIFGNNPTRVVDIAKGGDSFRTARTSQSVSDDASSASQSDSQTKPPPGDHAPEYSAEGPVPNLQISRTRRPERQAVVHTTGWDLLYDALEVANYILEMVVHIAILASLLALSR